MAEEKKPKIELQRRAVTVNSTNAGVYYAQETVSWSGGSVPIVGLGVSRAEALIATDVQFEALKKLLNIH